MQTRGLRSGEPPMRLGTTDALISATQSDGDAAQRPRATRVRPLLDEPYGNFQSLPSNGDTAMQLRHDDTERDRGHVGSECLAKREHPRPFARTGSG
jgi:hypothetical protein